jgi:hypothetical protein
MGVCRYRMSVGLAIGIVVLSLVVLGLLIATNWEKWDEQVSDRQLKAEKDANDLIDEALKPSREDPNDPARWVP